MAALEEEVYKQGGIMIYLGTDDEDGKTAYQKETFLKILMKRLKISVI